MYRLVVLSAFLATGALGQLVLDTPCNLAGIGRVENVDITKVAGVWNQIKRIGNSQESGQCSTLNITTKYQNEQPVDVEFATSEVVNKSRTTRGGNILINNELTGLFMFNFTDGTKLPFVILSMNYTRHVIVYSCIALNATRKEVWAWQYHRQTTVAASEQSYVDSVIANNNDLKNATWLTIRHDAATCNFGVVFGLSHLLLFVTMMFVGKEFV